MAVAACWGGSWLAGRLVAESGVHPLLAAAVRFLFGSAGLVAVSLYSGALTKPTRRALVPIGLMGITGILLYNLCFFYGLRFVPAGRASLITATQPCAIFLLMSLAGRQRPTLVKVAGLLTSLLGASLVLAQGNPVKLFTGGATKGDFVILGCMLSWMSYTLLGRWALNHMPALPVTLYSTLFGTMLLLCGVAFTGLSGIPEIPVKAWIALALLGLAGTTLAFVWYLSGVRDIGPANAAVFINFVPVFGVIFSALFLGETLTPFTIGGGLLVFVGVRLLNWK